MAESRWLSERFYAKIRAARGALAPLLKVTTGPARQAL
jgi:hypothetical protein